MPRQEQLPKKNDLFHSSISIDVEWNNKTKQTHFERGDYFLGGNWLQIKEGRNWETYWQRKDYIKIIRNYESKE